METRFKISSEKSIKLGLMPPLTGLVGIYGPEIERAARIACQEINESGGVLGRQLEIIVEDDGSLPESAVAAAEKLAITHGCSAIIGNLLSNSRIAVAYRVAEPQKIPYLNFSFYEGSIRSRYFFHFAALPNQQIDRMIPYMRRNFGPRMFFAGNNYEWPRGSIDAAKRALRNNGGFVVGEEYCPIGVDAETLESLLDRLEHSSADVFVPYFAGIDQVNLLTRFTERGLKNRMAVVMGHYDELMASKLPPEVRDGFFSSNTYFMTVDTDENRKILNRLASTPGVSGIWPNGNGILTNFGEGTYLCVKAFAKAANNVGSVNAEALVDSLKKISVTGPQGIVQMDAATQSATVNTFLARCDAQGRFTIVEKFGAISPVVPSRYKHQRIGHNSLLEDDIRLQARMLEQMSEAVILADLKTGTIIYANGGANRMFGYNETEMIGLPFTKLGVSENRETGPTSDEVMRAVVQAGSWQGDFTSTRKDGTRFSTTATVSSFTHPLLGEVWMSVHQDTTALKTREAQLEQSEDRLRRVIDATNDGIWDWNPITHEDYMSPQWKAILGYRDDELPNIRSTFLDLVHPDDRALVGDAVARHFVHNEPYRIEIRMMHKDGRARWILSRGEAARDSAGQPVRMVGSISDITRQKEAETALRESEQRFSTIFNKHPVACAIRRLSDDVIITCNPSFEKLLGYSHDEIAGKRVGDLSFYSFSEQRPFVVEKANLRESPSGQEVQLRTKNGTIKHILMTVELITLTGEECALASFVDITERKRVEQELELHRHHLEELVVERTRKLVRSEEQLREAHRIARLGHWSLDEDTGDIEWSQEVFRIHQRDPTNYRPTTDNYFRDVVHPSDVERVRREQQLAFRSGQQFDIDYRIYTPNGEVRWLHVEGVGHLDELGRYHLKGIAQDITTQKLQREKNETLERQLMQAQKMESLGQLTGGIAHDFNNILASIRGFTDLALRLNISDDKGKLNSYLNRIRQSTNQAADLVTQMLAFARKQNEVLVRNEISVMDVFNGFYHMIRPIVPATIDIEISTERDIPAVSANAVMLNQVFTNLCLNAKDAIQTGVGQIKLSARLAKISHFECASCHHSFSGEYVEIAVEDNGIGISPQLLKIIFEPFYTTKEVNKGTGMGLSMVHGIIHKHDGHIIVESKVGEGTSFRILLPIAKKPITEIAESLQKNDSDVTVDGNSAHILLVDDETAITTFIQEFLESYNYRVTSINCSVEALDYFEKMSPGIDLVVTDFTMPTLNGAQLAARMMARKPELPILLCTGYSEHIDEAKAKEMNIRAFLNKPINLDALLSHISSSLH